MDDNEGRVGHPRLLEVLAAGVPSVELLSPVLISPLGDLQKRKQDRVLCEEEKGSRVMAEGWGPSVS